ncbi:caspase family protein [Brevifollis gellanilyticus]|uniref:Peptidase C14 caspase domain-containing protein n=1 Tax=Brevifollis gellanilyticus TaxID=748831 RepID=A0A512MDI8_9BACT|nr:caspase family protein [Brevifollis gellanilyticus]GEP44799.1 hypothetical protein BGE01nite_40900 [Brevifollis gellanilyticus]
MSPAFHTHIFSIGINEYINYRSLRCCVNDAEKIAAELTGLAQNLQSCSLSTGTNGTPRPTQAEVRDVLSKIGALDAGESDIVFFYFAGHGSQFEGRDYLLCNDTAKDLVSAISTDEVIASLVSSKAGTAVLIIDACRSEFTRDANSFGERTAELARRRGVVTFFACSPGEVSQELVELDPGHGVFTYAFLGALKQLSHITPLDLDRKVCEEVASLCQRYRLSKQRPYTAVAPIQKSLIDLVTGKLVVGLGAEAKKCILISGPSNAGKTTLGQFIASEFGYVHVEMSTFAWQRYLQAESFAGNIQEFMEDVVWKDNSFDVIARDLLDSRLDMNKIVICGSRRPEEIETLKKQGWNMIELYLYANSSLRFKRHLDSSPKSRFGVDYRAFVKRDMQEYAWGLAKVATMPNFKLLTNEGSIESLLGDTKAFLSDKA